MLVATVTFIRESASTPFYTVEDSFRDIFQQRYVETGKVTSTETHMSTDGLTYTLISNWKSKAEFDAFLVDADGIAMKEARLLYCVTNNITVDYAGELINDDNDPYPQGTQG
jgi:hypothetical protein